MKVPLAALAALVCVSAPALAVPPPVPFGLTFVDRTNDCISDEEMWMRLVAVVQQGGGRGLMLTDSVQQAFGDEWRKLVGLPSVKISVSMVWLRSVAVAVTEFDEKGCLLTMSGMSLADYNVIAEATKAAVKHPVVLPDKGI